MKEFPVRNNFEPYFYDEVGRLVVAFGRLEYLIKLCIKQLMGQGFKQGMIHAESKRQFALLCKEAAKLAREKLPTADADFFCKQIECVRSLGYERNDTVHAFWTIHDSGAPLRIRPDWNKSKKQVDWSKGGVVPLVGLRELRKQAEEIYLELDKMRKNWPVFHPNE